MWTTFIVFWGSCINDSEVKTLPSNCCINDSEVKTLPSNCCINDSEVKTLPSNCKEHAELHTHSLHQFPCLHPVQMSWIPD